MSAGDTHRICLLDGDGIGPEVVAAAAAVLSAVIPRLESTRARIGFGVYEELGTPLPRETVDAVRSADATLFGAVTTPPGIPGYRSPILALRQDLQLFANVRPVRARGASSPALDLVIVRENTEGLYAGRERREGDTAIAERVVTRAASERIVRYALDLARARPRRRLTIVHKANVLRETCGLFREVALELAADWPDVETNELLVDAAAMELIRDPGRFDVIVTTNLFGDILSDEAAALAGGLGLACSANVGRDAAIFEPVHGSAPDIAGTGAANPLAAILSAAMLLAHLGEADAARRVEAAVEQVLASGPRTPDLGGTAGTAEITDAVIAALDR